jgi:uncharacterized membrane protein YfcA
MVYTALTEFFPILTTIPGVAAENQLRSVIFLLALRSFASNLFALKFIFKEAKWELVKYAAPLACVCCLIGCYFLDAFVHTWWMRPMLGIVFGIFGLLTLGIRIKKSVDLKNKTQKHQQELEEQEPSSPPTSYIHPARQETTTNTKNKTEEELHDAKSNDPEYLKRITPFLMIACAISGFLGGTINVSGPPFIVASLLLEFPRRLSRSTFPLIALTTYTTRFLYTLATGSFFDPTVFSLPHAIGVVVSSLVGLYIGDSLGRIVSNEQYLQICSILLLCAGFSIGGVSVWITWGFFLICLIWFIWTNKKRKE